MFGHFVNQIILSQYGIGSKTYGFKCTEENNFYITKQFNRYTKLIFT